MDGDVQSEQGDFSVRASVNEKRRSNTLGHYHCYCNPLFINNLLVVLQIHDITEKVNSERKVVEYQQKFISAFHGSSVGMMVGKIDGNFTEVNDALCHFLGYSRKELLQKGLAGISHPDDVQQDSRTSENDYRRNQWLYRGEEYVHKSGKIVLVCLR